MRNNLLGLTSACKAYSIDYLTEISLGRLFIYDVVPLHTSNECCYNMLGGSHVLQNQCENRLC